MEFSSRPQWVVSYQKRNVNLAAGDISGEVIQFVVWKIQYTQF